MRFTTISLLAPLCALTLVSSNPIPSIKERTTYPTQVSYPAGGLNVYATNAAPIITLSNGVVVNFQATDSNLVVYASNQPQWAAGAVPAHSCAAPNVCELVFQYQGNLVRYVNGVATWSTPTAGTGTKLVFSDTRPFVAIYNAQNQVVWQTLGPNGDCSGNSGKIDSGCLTL
jgi:hypothetical protein